VAHALLAVITAAEREHTPADAGLIDLTCAEVRRLLTHHVDWSRWHRDQQHRAKTCHYASYNIRLS